MDRDTIDHIISQLADIIVTFEQALLTGRTANQCVACCLVTLARARLIEDLARLPQDALCELRD